MYAGPPKKYLFHPFLRNFSQAEQRLCSIYLNKRINQKRSTGKEHLQEAPEVPCVPLCPRQSTLQRGKPTDGRVRSFSHRLYTEPLLLPGAWPTSVNKAKICVPIGELVFCHGGVENKRTVSKEITCGFLKI